MSWTSPRTWVAAELVTASLLNIHVRDNLNALRDYMLGAQDLGANWLVSGRQLYVGATTIALNSTRGVMVYYNGADAAAASGYECYLDNTTGSLDIHGFFRSRLTAGNTYNGLEIGTVTSHSIRFLIAGTADANEIMRIQTGGVKVATFLGVGVAVPTTYRAHFQFAGNSINGVLIEDSAITGSPLLLEVTRAGVTQLRVSATGITGIDQVLTGGLCVGFSGTPTADEIQVGDAAFKLDFVSSTDVRVFADANDYLGYDRSTDSWAFFIGSASQLLVNSLKTVAINLEATKLSLVAGVTSASGTILLGEITAPGAPASNNAVIFAVDVAGKTTLKAQFPTGSAVTIVSEP